MQQRGDQQAREQLSGYGGQPPQEPADEKGFRPTSEQWIRGIWKTMHKTVVFVTHDIDEALKLGTKVAVMTNRPGKIAKVFYPSFTVQVDVNNTQEIRSLPEFTKMRQEIHRSM